VEAIVFDGLASSLALLTNEQKEMGALVIDLGAGATEYAVYSNGIIKQIGVLAVGSDHVSNDLAFGLKVPLSRAEELKIQHGSAVLDGGIKGQTVTVKNELGFAGKTINIEHLRRIMALRLEEIFELIEQQLSGAGLLDYLRAGVVLSGGGARTADIQKLAENVFQLPAVVGKTNCVNGLRSALDQPEFATGIGLVKFGSFQQKKRRTGVTRTIRESFQSLLKRE
jgi:cell division protein FtsA